jgi:hypothetical protein
MIAAKVMERTRSKGGAFIGWQYTIEAAVRIAK